MTYLDLVISSLYQGVAMIGPFSADVLFPRLFPWTNDPTIGPILKAIVSLGAGLALAVLLNKEIFLIGRSAWGAVKHRHDGSLRMLISLLLASAPLVVLDVLSPHSFDLAPSISAALVVLSAIVLFMADKYGVTVREMDHISIPSYLIIGVLLAGSQMIGVAPQLTAIIAARLMGCERDQAARIAFLVIIPHLLAGFGDFFSGPTSPPLAETLLTGTMAFVVALASAALLLNWLYRRSFALPALVQAVVGGLVVLSVTGFSR